MRPNEVILGGFGERLGEREDLVNDYTLVQVHTIWGDPPGMPGRAPGTAAQGGGSMDFRLGSTVRR